MDRVIRQGFDAVKNAGTLTNGGEVTDVRQRSIALPAATNGQGQLFGQATTSRFTDRQASGFGEAFGQATTSRLTDRQATGIGQGLGTAIENHLDYSLLVVLSQSTLEIQNVSTVGKLFRHRRYKTPEQ
ncbi:hypothetical protein OSG_eHP41_00015 [environmental Halophage eHP-41]|nr:hypothetical protein OSG_eHP41_00015 [environmental Halophage eHP-41]